MRLTLDCRCEGKTHRELLDLEDDITQQLNDGEAADPEYWTAVLRRLQIAKVISSLVYKPRVYTNMAVSLADAPFQSTVIDEPPYVLIDEPPYVCTGPGYNVHI